MPHTVRDRTKASPSLGRNNLLFPRLYRRVASPPDGQREIERSLPSPPPSSGSAVSVLFTHAVFRCRCLSQKQSSFIHSFSVGSSSVLLCLIFCYTLRQNVAYKKLAVNNCPNQLLYDFVDLVFHAISDIFIIPPPRCSPVSSPPGIDQARRSCYAVAAVAPASNAISRPTFLPSSVVVVWLRCMLLE